MAGSFLRAIGQALNKKGGWTDPSKLTGARGKQDLEIKKRLRIVDNFVLEEHFRLLNRQYFPGKVASKPGQYPKSRTGKLQGFLYSKIQLPKKGSPIRGIKYTYDNKEIVSKKGFKYAEYIFSSKGNRKSIYNVLLKLENKINKILGTEKGIEVVKF